MVATDSRTHSCTQSNSTQSDTVAGNTVKQLVDARGLSCPMPLLKAKLALNSCEVGECVRILATDPGSVRDFHAFAKLSAHALIEFTEREDEYDYLLEKGDLS